MEKELRKAENLRGTPVLLGNGETWTVPSLPFGKKGKVVATQYDALTKSDFGEDVDKAIGAMIDAMVVHLQLNYPALTRENVEDAGLFDAQIFGEFCAAVGGPEPKKV